MAQELPKAYEPKETESKWSQFWEDRQLYRACSTSDKPPYCIVMPPPNVTGVLHMGHALVNTLQDILIRWKRMSGYEALWVPGTDHAGIATQTVVERHLMATTGKRRSDFSREEFLKKIWEWKEKHESTILGQLKRMGCSCDWSRLRFTMDEGCNLAVGAMFKKLFDAGLIYRGDYLVNWDPVTQTALADDEVEYEDRETFLWYFKYHLVDDTGFIQIATTRPETMLGDTAIAVSPKDERYKHLIGKKVHLPFVDRQIPIIGDHHVDPEFGTGALKITPAHDPNDYRIGIEHDLPMINILTPDGRMNENSGPFEGMSREKARESVVQAMQERGLVEKIEKYKNRIGVSYRSKAIIEPYLSKQWFIKMAPFIEPLKQAVIEGEVKILPASWKNTYFHWIDNLRDWCISRQLWWGHRIPVWYNKDNPEQMLCSGTGEIPAQVKQEPDLWEQDEDVLDTWFSSALWPFSTLGWPEKTTDVNKFYPNAVLITGHDILFFWVARMILMGKEAMKEAPFPETFLHGLIYGKSYWKKTKDGSINYITGDEKKQYDMGKPVPSSVLSKWEKLSKSKGNVIDPIEMIEEYGTDAVRMSLCASANQSPQIDLDRRRFEEFKNFANKIWNGARFIFMHLEDLDSKELSSGLDESLLNLEDKWILSSLNRVNEKVNASLSNYQFDNAAMTAYDFYWKQFCAYYLEITKPFLFGKAGSKKERTNKQKLLVIILSNALRLMHPMAPFITEELFQKLKEHFPNLESHKQIDPYTKEIIAAFHCEACMTAPYPTVIRKKDIFPKIEEAFAFMEEVIHSIRNIRGEMKIPPHMATDIYLIGNHPTIKDNLNMISALVKTENIEIMTSSPSISACATAVIGDLTIMIPLPQELLQKEGVRLEKEKEKLSNGLERLKKQLSNQAFLEKAHPQLVEKQKSKLIQTEQELKVVIDKLNTIGKSS